MRFILILCLLCLGVSVGALEGIYAGLGTEINANSPRGPAVLGGLTLGFDLHRHWTAGLRAGYSPNMYVSSALEPVAFGRYYLLPGSGGPFVQGEAGCIIIFAFDEDFIVFSGGFATGWRFNLARNVYVEPALRLGYPYLFGVSLNAGLRFKIRN